MQNVKEALAFWLPNYTCQACGTEIQASPNDYLCPECLAKLPLAPTTPGHYAPFVYAEPVRSMILALKHGDNCLPARALAPYLAAVYLQTIRTDAPQYLVPVPLHRGRLRDRGYNQSLVLAEAMAAEVALPILAGVLVRTKKTKMQKKMDAAARAANVKDAFAVVDPALVCGKDLILLDDVYTTGATTRECTRVLRAAGARRVTILTVATAGL